MPSVACSNQEMDLNMSIEYRIEASTTNPETRQGFERDNLQDYDITTASDEVRRQTIRYLRRGYWVEIYNNGTDELFAGPYDPDLPEPAFIL